MTWAWLRGKTTAISNNEQALRLFFFIKIVYLA